MHQNKEKFINILNVYIYIRICVCLYVCVYVCGDANDYELIKV